MFVARATINRYRERFDRLLVWPSNLKLVRMVRAANHGAAGDVEKTHFARPGAILLEARRWNKLYHRQMSQGGLQILAERENIAGNRAQIAQGGEELIFGFTQT